MCRNHFTHTTAMPVGSSNYKTVLAKQESLAAGHEERMKEINKMTFKVTNPTVNHHYGQSPYLMVFGRIVKLHRNEVARAIEAGYNVLWS